MAATSAASMMKNPAEAAFAPDGPTQTTIGISEASIRLTMSSIAVTSPPGVSSWIKTRSSPSASASSIATMMRLAVAPVTATSSNSTSRMTGCSAAKLGAPSRISGRR
jgi:hypothetical protein